MKTINIIILCLVIGLTKAFPQPPACPTSTFIASPITFGGFMVEASEHVIAESNVSPPSNYVIYKAEQSVQLLPGFNTTITNGAYFQAHIAPCGSWKQAEIPGTAYNAIKEASLLAYPNPFSDDITIEYSLAQGEKGQLAVYSILGQLIVTQDLGNATTETQQLSLKTETWALGIYVVSLYQSNGEKKTIKVIKQ